MDINAKDVVIYGIGIILIFVYNVIVTPGKFKMRIKKTFHNRAQWIATAGIFTSACYGILQAEGHLSLSNILNSMVIQGIIRTIVLQRNDPNGLNKK